jgi:hypothetical protein
MELYGCVGYIASELCKYLHPLIATGDVVDVYVQCIKYRVDFLLKNRILSKNFHKDHTWGRLFKGGLVLTLG